VCNNAKLQEMIQNRLDDTLRQEYQARLNEALMSNRPVEGMKLQVETTVLEKATQVVRDNLTAILTLAGIVVIFSAAVVIGLLRRRY
jgi:hypothetical protein